MKFTQNEQGHFIDGNNNIITKDINLKEAIKQFETLIKCVNCIDCENCTYCKNCKNCTYCTDCKNCERCKNCEYREDCYICEDCEGVTIMKIVRG